MREMNLLGVKVHAANESEALQSVKNFLYSEGQKYIFTPNPEMVVKAQTDKYFTEVLERGALNLCDGTGLFLYAKNRGIEIERIQGVDFMQSICELCSSEEKKIFLLGSGSREVVESVKTKLLQKYPTLAIVGVDSGLPITEGSDGRLNFDPTLNERIVGAIDHLKPDVLFVAFGMGKQEKWIVENAPKLGTVKVAMGVGGAFDYISGKVPRAPLLLRRIGLEWLYRLFRQPRRLVRIFNATIRFASLARKKV